MNKLEAYDPIKHKCYVPLIKNGHGRYVHPARVAGHRAQGWKTVKEVQEINAKRDRKAAKNVQAVVTVLDTILTKAEQFND